MNAYFVVGPESSGGGYTKNLLEAAGAEVVIHRAMPHVTQWWHMRDLLTLADRHNPFAVVTTRDHHAMCSSQVKSRGWTNPAQVEANIRRAYTLIFSGLAECQIPFIVSPYEAHAHDGYQRWLTKFLGLEATTLDWSDKNSKHYGAMP